MLSSNLRFTLGTAAALSLVTACSGGGSSTSNPAVPALSPLGQVRQAASTFRGTDASGKFGLPAGFRTVLTGVPERSPGWLSEDAKKPIAKVYVSDNAANAVYIFNAKSPTAPIGTITSGISGPLGSFVDASGNLYVANITSNTVTVYAKGTTKPSKTYSTGLSEPIGVAVGSDGTVYVSEFAPGQVVEFDKGSMSPSRTIAINEAEGVALDSTNHLFVSYIDSSTGTGQVQKFAPKTKKGVNLGISVGFAGDLKLDKNNDVLLEDQTAQTVNFYKPGKSTSYGSIAVGSGSYKLALNAAESLAYVATTSIVDIFTAAPSGKSVGMISSGLQSAYGVSLSPAAPLGS